MSAQPRAAGARTRVLHVVAPMRAGGLEQVVASLAAAQRAAGAEAGAMVVLEPGTDEPQLLPALRAGDVAVHVLRVGARQYAAEWAAVARMVRELQPDVVHTHGYRADVLAGASARRAGAPVVSTVHGFTGGTRRNRFYEWLQVRALRRCDAVAAVSRPLAERLRAERVPADRLVCVRNGFAPMPTLPRADARAALGLPADARVVGWVGRLSREKGPDVALRALAALARRGDHSTLLAIVGEGREAEKLGAQAQEAGLTIRLRWVGLRPRAAEVLRAFDAFLLSSRTEGTPITLLEAMAAGVPIVATRVGGVPDVVSSEEALLVASEDADAMATALETIAQDPEAARRRARRARERLGAQFAVEPWVAAYERIYAAARLRRTAR